MTGGSLRHRRAVMSVALTAAVLGLCAIPVVAEYLARYRWATDTLETVDQRYARLLGLREAGAKIGEALAASKEVLHRQAYDEGMASDRVGAEMQQRVRCIAESAGLSVAGSQILKARPGDGFEIVPMSATLEGEFAGLRDFLVKLANESPAIVAESIAVTSARTGRNSPDGRVRVQIGLGAVRVLP